MTSALYNAEILRLATSLAGQPRLADAGVTVERRSPTCGSRVIVDMTIKDDQVAAFGLEVRACALGQAGAALLGRSIVGARVGDVAKAADDLRAYLSGAQSHPGAWPDLDILAPARAYPARHPSILLAFDAAAAAVRGP